MGGFAGGDEAGYWDDTRFRIAPSKEGSPLSLPGIEYQLDSMPVAAHITSHDDSIGTLSFIPCQCDTLTLSGLEGNSQLSHRIRSLYDTLLQSHEALEIEEFFQSHRAEFSSDEMKTEDIYKFVIAFLRLLKEAANLMLSDTELINIIHQES